MLQALAYFYHYAGVHDLVQDIPEPWKQISLAHPGSSMVNVPPLTHSLTQNPAQDHPAYQARTREALRQAIQEFKDCPLRHTATNLVFSDGNPHAPIMFVGEAPGRDEDLAGTPFVGRAGRLLNAMLASIGLDRSQIYITNILPWRPPNNRTPTTEEQLLYAPFVRQHIRLIRPRILVCLGSIAAKRLLPIDKSQGIIKARGHWLPYAIDTDQAIDALPMFHPAYLLRQPSQKKFAWLDLLLIQQKLKILCDR